MNIRVDLAYSCKGQSLMCNFLWEQVFHLFGKHQISGMTFFLLLKVDSPPQIIYPLSTLLPHLLSPPPIPFLSLIRLWLSFHCVSENFFVWIVSFDIFRDCITWHRIYPGEYSLRFAFVGWSTLLVSVSFKAVCGVIRGCISLSILCLFYTLLKVKSWNCRWWQCRYPHYFCQLSLWCNLGIIIRHENVCNGYSFLEYCVSFFLLNSISFCSSGYP